MRAGRRVSIMTTQTLARSLAYSPDDESIESNGKAGNGLETKGQVVCVEGVIVALESDDVVFWVDADGRVRRAFALVGARVGEAMILRR